MPDHSLNLSDQLCFSLYTAQRLVTAAYRPILEDLGLTYAQYVAMLALWESAPMTVGELGERLGLDYGTVTPVLKRLQAAGLVDRRRMPDDERTVQIVLTDEGSALRAKAAPVPDAMADVMALDKAAFTELQEALEQLSSNVGRKLA